MRNSTPVDIVTVAKTLQKLADERRERQMKAMTSQPRHRPEGGRDPSPWQENAIRIMEDRSE